MQFNIKSKVLNNCHQKKEILKIIDMLKYWLKLSFLSILKLHTFGDYLTIYTV